MFSNTDVATCLPLPGGTDFVQSFAKVALLDGLSVRGCEGISSFYIFIQDLFYNGYKIAVNFNCANGWSDPQTMKCVTRRCNKS